MNKMHDSAKTIVHLTLHLAQQCSHQTTVLGGLFKKGVFTKCPQTSLALEVASSKQCPAN